MFADAAHAELARAAGAPQVLELGDALDRVVAAASDAPMDPAGPSGGPMIYTSGTTGRPKGVRRARPARLDAALEQLRARARARVGLDGSGPHLVTGPDLPRGARHVRGLRPDERRAARHHAALGRARARSSCCATRAIEHAHLVPTMFVRLLRLPEAERAAFRAPSLQVVLHGAAPISPAIKRQHDRRGGARCWSSTGAAPRAASSPASAREEWLAHPETVGRALPGYEVFAVDDDGRRLPPGENGLLYARHARVRDACSSTTPTRRRRRRAYLEPGVFTLGDIGRVDADGYVALADRSAHTIISGGVNIYPAEIEAVLQEHPAVADVAVFGIPDDEWGEQVKAAVELAPGHAPSPALADELLAFARERLARLQGPALDRLRGRAAASPVRASSTSAACAIATGRGASGRSDSRGISPS